MLEDTNNQLWAHYLELVNKKWTLHNRDKDLATVKTQLFKLHTKNKHMVVEGVEAKKVIKKVEALQ
jgi:hypothetical protein